MKSEAIEKLLWSIALPGFGQILNGKLWKGFLFIGLEFLVNVQSGLNEVIMASFHGDIAGAVERTDYEWLLFYPCLYMFAMWDAYKDAGGGTTGYAAVPFAFGAYFGTVGVMFSTVLLGPVWLGLIGLFVGIGAGLILRAALRKWTRTGRNHP